MFRRNLWCALLSLAPLFALSARADVFILRNQGQVQGKLLNDKESPRKTYVVLTENGEVTLEKSQVVKVIKESPALQEYQKIQASFADSVEGQLEAAAWCKKRKLSVQRKGHLERVIELDPENLEARQTLGHIRVNGKWTTRAEDLARKGYVQHEGKWLLPQEVQIQSERKAIEEATVSWRKKLRLWRKWLDDIDRAHAARQEFLAIRDVRAIAPMLELLKDEKDVARRVLYVESLSQIGEGAATHVLVDHSLHDGDPELRDTCLDYVVEHPHPDVTAAYVKALSSHDNEVVNRAAKALARLKDSSAVAALIDALNTTHKFKIKTGNGNTSAGFVGPQGGGPGSGGFNFSQGSGTKIVTQDFQNEAVRDALILITEQNHQFDEDAWKKWHRSQRKDHKFSPRRDERA